MKKLISFIAISLDGKIADAQGGVGWIDLINQPENEDYGYYEFIKTIDTTIMGNATYQQVLGFDLPFPYTEQKNYVLSRNNVLVQDEHVTFITSDHAQKIAELKKAEGKDIWLIGGGTVNSLCMKEGLLDEMIVHVMPYVLGAGISLFAEVALGCHLNLKDSKIYSSGVVEMRYRVERG